MQSSFFFPSFFLEEEEGFEGSWHFRIIVNMAAVRMKAASRKKKRRNPEQSVS